MRRCREIGTSPAQSAKTALHGDQRGERAVTRALATAGEPDEHQPGSRNCQAAPLPWAEVQSEPTFGQHGKEHQTT